MNRLHQAAIAQAYHHAHLASHQIAVQALLLNRRRAGVLLGLHDRHVCDLSDALVAAIDMPATIRRLILSAERHQHILERRQLAAHFDESAPDVSTNRLSEALADVRYLVAERRNSNIWEVIGHVGSAKRFVLVAIKLVSRDEAGVQKQELWVQTAHPISKKRLRRMLASGEVVSIDAT